MGDRLRRRRPRHRSPRPSARPPACSGCSSGEIVPLFYDRDTDGVPVGWINKMKDNWRSLGPFVTAARMVRDYTSPSCTNRPQRSATATTRRLRIAWQGPGSLEADASSGRGPTCRSSTSTSTRRPPTRATSAHVRARVELGGARRRPRSRCRCCTARSTRQGSFIGTSAGGASSQTNGRRHVRGHLPVGEAGPYGVTVRAVPGHHDLISPMDMGLVAWAD